LILFMHLFIPLKQSKQQTTGTYIQAGVSNLVQVLRLPVSKGHTRIGSPFPLPLKDGGRSRLQEVMVL